MRDRGLAAALVLALTLSCGCRSAPPPNAPILSPPKARNAAELAWDIVHAGVGAMIYVERIRDRPIAAKIEALALFDSLLKDTTLHPESDIDRAFIAAPSTNRSDEVIVVAQHHLSNVRIKAEIDALIATGRIQGAWIDGRQVPLARVTIRNHAFALALIEPNFVVVLPEAHEQEATRFVGTGGFPDPLGPEAVVANAIDPARTLHSSRIPAIPPTLQSAHATVTLTDDGGADVAVDASSTNSEQAAADAAAVTRSVDEATSIKVAFMRLRVFKAIPFSAEDDQVRSRVHLTPGEIDVLFGAISAFLPR